MQTKIKKRKESNEIKEVVVTIPIETQKQLDCFIKVFSTYPERIKYFDLVQTLK
jgi:hypothetical protein